MANDQSAVAFERLDEVADEDRRPAAAPVCDLAELAAALAQVEALIIADADESPDAAAAAVERIADIAFVLQEREVEPSLCDALDAAMRDISEANARNRASLQRAHEAAELLRALAQRVDAMMAAQAAAVTPAAGGLQEFAHGDELECADEFPAPARLFDGDVAEDAAFARTVAALAESLPDRAEAAPAELLDQVRDSGAAFEASTRTDGETLEEATSPTGCTHPAEVMSAVAGLESHENAATASVTEPSSDSDPAGFADLGLSDGAVTVSPVDVNRSIDPDEDPGDLFEPIAGMRPAPEAPAPVAAAQETAPVASPPPQSPRAGASAPAPFASRPVANDPLAPIRALSEEELIALFS